MKHYNENFVNEGKQIVNSDLNPVAFHDLALLADHAPLQFQWPWRVIGQLKLEFLLQEKGVRTESMLQRTPLHIPAIV